MEQAREIPYSTESIVPREWLAAIFLIVLQLLDAIYTYRGVMSFGVNSEGNLILRTMMESFGVGMALLMAKFFALVCIVFLVKQASSKVWITNALYSLGVFYLVFAILPWSFLSIYF